MTSIFDARLLRVIITLDGVEYAYENLDIEAYGSKSSSPTENAAVVRIANLKPETTNNLLTNASPFLRPSDRPRQTIRIEAGRESSGYSTVYVGDITGVSQTQRPDVYTEIESKTSQYPKGNYVQTAQPASSAVSTIAQGIADQLGLSLKFEATDKQVSNYSFSGSPTIQLSKLRRLGFYDAYVDDETLVVKNSGEPLTDLVKIVSPETGMVGIPEITEYGVRVTFFFDGSVGVGSKINAQSKIYTEINGEYIISKLDFMLTNRQTAFYYVAECERPKQSNSAQTITSPLI